MSKKFYADVVKGTDVENYQFEDIVGRPDDSPNNILRLAAGVRWIALAECALQNGADIHYSGEFALRLACGHSKYDPTGKASLAMVRFLLSKGADSRIFSNREYLLKADNPFYSDDRSEKATPGYATANPLIADLLVEHAQQNVSPLPYPHQMRLGIRLKQEMQSLPCEKRRAVLLGSNNEPTETLVNIAQAGMLPYLFQPAHWQGNLTDAGQLLRDIRHALPFSLKSKVDDVDPVPFASPAMDEAGSFATSKRYKIDTGHQR